MMVDETYLGIPCLSDETLKRINSHFQGKIRLADEELMICCKHVQQCTACAAKVETLRPVADAGLLLVMQQESLHTSFPPELPDTCYDQIVTYRTELSPDLAFA